MGAPVEMSGRSGAKEIGDYSRSGGWRRSGPLVGQGYGVITHGRMGSDLESPPPLPDVRLDEKRRNPMSVLESSVEALESQVNAARPFHCPTCWLRYQSAQDAHDCCAWWLGRTPASLQMGQGNNRNGAVAPLADDTIDAVKILTRRGWGEKAIRQILRKNGSATESNQISHAYNSERRKVMAEQGLETALDWRAWQGRRVGADCPGRGYQRKHANAMAWAKKSILEMGQDRLECEASWFSRYGGRAKSGDLPLVSAYYLLLQKRVRVQAGLPDTAAAWAQWLRSGSRGGVDL